VGPRAGLDVLGKSKMACSSRDSNSPTFDYATPVPRWNCYVVNIIITNRVCIYVCMYIYNIYIIYIYRMSQKECARLQESVPYVKIYLYNPKHLCPKLNGYGDNGQRSLKL
jgi:hypothetical protein